MNLFADLSSEKRTDEIEDVENQTCTYALYFTLAQRDEFKRLCKIGIKAELGEDANKGNVSTHMLNLLKRTYENDN